MRNIMNNRRSSRLRINSLREEVISRGGMISRTVNANHAAVEDIAKAGLDTHEMKKVVKGASIRDPQELRDLPVRKSTLTLITASSTRRTLSFTSRSSSRKRAQLVTSSSSRCSRKRRSTKKVHLD